MRLCDTPCMWGWSCYRLHLRLLWHPTGQCFQPLPLSLSLSLVSKTRKLYWTRICLDIWNIKGKPNTAWFHLSGRKKYLRGGVIVLHAKKTLVWTRAQRKHPSAAEWTWTGWMRSNFVGSIMNGILWFKFCHRQVLPSAVISGDVEAKKTLFNKSLFG